jgi:tetratricopeptide (TPR) repeat protein
MRDDLFGDDLPGQAGPATGSTPPGESTSEPPATPLRADGVPAAAPDAAPASASAPAVPTPAVAPLAAESSRLLRLAREHEASDDNEAALDRYEALLALDPASIDGRVGYARLLERLERGDAALAVLDDGVRRLPDQTEFLVQRAGLLGHRRRFSDAEADLRRVLRLYPSHGPAHFELGLMLWRKGRAAEAAESFSRSLVYQPDNPVTLYYLAEALNQLGRLAEARMSSERSLELDPRQPRVYNLLGRVLDGLGRSDDATRMYRLARENSTT